MDDAGGALQAPGLYVCGVHTTVRRCAVKEGSYALYRAYGGQEGVVAIEDDGTARLHILEHLGLLLHDALPGLEEFQVGHADVCEHAHIGLGHGGELSHFTEVVDAHLQDGHLMLLLQVKDS